MDNVVSQAGLTRKLEINFMLYRIFCYWLCGYVNNSIEPKRELNLLIHEYEINNQTNESIVKLIHNKYRYNDIRQSEKVY